ncbi:MAG TPA: DUF3352 domain-containing protein [Mycobacteriales bacterium]|nr:DUF3352 domain-containing protein [Mycobacteriales bacterium]
MDDEARSGGYHPEPPQDPRVQGPPPPYGGPPPMSNPYGEPSYGGPQPGGPGEPGPYPHPGPYGGEPRFGPPPYGPPPYRQGQYGPLPYGQGQYDYLSSAVPPPGGQPPPRRSRGKLLWAGIAAATAVALTAGGVYAYTALAGGGTALASRIPADAVAYAEVNLDPPAGQKVAALRFFRHFPDLKVGGDSGSLIESLIEPLINDAEARREFTANVKPWLGKHIAIAADPQGDAAHPVVVAETTDAAKSRAGLDKLNADQQNAEDKVSYAVDGDIVVLAEKQSIADTALKDARAGSLESNETFTSDRDQVGDDGVVTAWADLAKAARYGTGFDRSGAAEVKGRLAASLRFTDTTADLLVRGVGNKTNVGTEVVGPRLATLPDDTAVAVAISGGAELVRSAYGQLKKAGLGDMLAEAEKDTGLAFPDDLAGLLGTSTVLAASGSGDKPELGLIARTTDPDRARRAAEKLLRKLDGSQSLAAKRTPDGTVLASSVTYAERLAAAGRLGQQEQFKAALPELDRAQVAAYVDLRRSAEMGGEPLPDSTRALRSLGLIGYSSGDSSTVRMRVVVG